MRGWSKVGWIVGWVFAGWVAVVAPAQAYTVVSRAADVRVDCGSNGTDVPTDWYFPQPNDNKGLVWVQHGFSRANNHFEELSIKLAEQGYIVFATSLAPGTSGCAMNNQGFLSDFARLFPDRHNPSVGLLKSAKVAAQAAGITLNDLPDAFAFTGHSAGGGSIAWVTRKLIENHASTATALAGLVFLDPVEGAGASLIADATPVLRTAGVRAHTISSPGYTCNSSANGTVAFVNAINRPFAGVRLTSGCHCDAEASSSDFLCTGFCGSPQAENVSILQTLTKGWIADAFGDTITTTYYPGGTYYQSKIANGRILTFPESNCGNGVVNAGEACDDGNRFDGDCCSGYCQFEANGSACAADANGCTNDVCNGAGVCTHPNNTAPCDDGNFCTVGDVCGGGSCGGSPRDCSSAGNACNIGVCNESSDTCVAQPANQGGACDDGNACTQTDTCQSGTCSGGNAVVCTAQDQCHDAGVCDPGTGVCSNPAKANGTTCNDGNACTQTDTCQAGSCSGGNAVVCTAQDQCHDAGTCDPGTGICSNPTKVDGATCNDGNACTQTDTCQAGSCSGTNAVICTAQDQCHDAGLCDPGTGVCSNPAKANGTSCDDGSACTQTDTCQAGSCSGANPIVCSAQDQCHDVGVCDPGTGVCSNPAKADGATCNDGNACTQTDTCQAGSCSGGNAVVCTAQDQCHDSGICDPGTGTCSNPAKADGTTCSDSNACTQTDTCQAGSCNGANAVVCTALDQCHDAGVCDPGSGVCSNPPKANGTTCNDGDACTLTDICVTGTCTGGNHVDCTALDQCHDAGSCDPATGVCSNPAKANGSPCSDGDACTQVDTCQAGACSAGTPVVCTPLDACHAAGTCDPASGLCSNPSKADGSACSDGDACTLEECRAGACTNIGTPCGDGALQVACGEACDDGAANGSNACCSATCTVVDGDDDGLCDRDDACTGAASMSSAKVRVKGLGTPGENGGLMFKGAGVLPHPFDPTLDPSQRGLRLLVGDAATHWLDVTIPAGEFSKASGRGWKASSAGRWKYFDRSDAPIGGVTKLSVRDRSSRTPGEVEVAIKASVPSVVVEENDLPLSVTVVFDVPTAMQGQCAATAFEAQSCELGRTGTSAQCR